MQTYVRTSGKTTILDLQGDLVRGGEGKIFELVKQLVASGQKSVLLNLAEIRVMDSIGIGALVMAYKNIAAAGGKLKLLNPSIRTRQLLGMTSLNSVFEIFDDEATAVASFAVIGNASPVTNESQQNN
jgi:anti-sigma B factor antagonist